MMNKIISLKVTNEEAQMLLMKRLTSKQRYNILLNAEIIGMKDEHEVMTKSALDYDKIQREENLKRIAAGNIEIFRQSPIYELLRQRQICAQSFLENASEHAERAFDECDKQIKKFLCL